MKSVLIIGGSGFIGTNLIETLLTQKNLDILNLDIKEPQLKAHLPLWQKVDICDEEQLTTAVLNYNPEYVVHLAARTDLQGASIEEYAANTVGVKNLLNALERLPNLKTVLFTSSMYVCRPGYQPKDFDDYAPHTIYGESKVLTEKIIKERSPSYNWAIMRPTSIWGPFFSEPYNRFFKIVMKRMYFHLGEKACKKTYGYIDNTIYQILALLKRDTAEIKGKTFYLGDYTPYDITEWANEIAASLGFKIPKIPFFLFRIAALGGDALKKMGINFPMTSFRLKNMTTDNIQDLTPIQFIAPDLPVSRKEGVKKTIAWLMEQKQIK